MIWLRILATLYLTLGIAHVIVRRTWQSTIYSVRIAAKLGPCNCCEPTPILPLLIALPIGFLIDLSLWPINEWTNRKYKGWRAGEPV